MEISKSRTSEHIDWSSNVISILNKIETKFQLANWKMSRTLHLILEEVKMLHFLSHHWIDLTVQFSMQVKMVLMTSSLSIDRRRPMETTSLGIAPGFYIIRLEGSWKYRQLKTVWSSILPTSYQSQEKIHLIITPSILLFALRLPISTMLSTILIDNANQRGWSAMLVNNADQ